MSAKGRAASQRKPDNFLLATAGFVLLKGVLLVAVTAGLANLFHKDVREHVEHWLNILRVDPDNEYVGAFLTKLNVVHTKELKQLTALGCFYSALFLTQGVGLMWQQRWAEWLTILATGIFLPLEIYEMFREFGLFKLALFVINAAIVAFLARRVAQKN
jgi:uncharacterized membrane protein (DUF2068 family)